MEQRLACRFPHHFLLRCGLTAVVPFAIAMLVLSTDTASARVPRPALRSVSPTEAPRHRADLPAERSVEGAPNRQVNEAVLPGLPIPAMPAPRPAVVLPGEFDRQDAVLISWDPGNLEVQKTLAEIAAAVWSKVRLMVLVNSSEQRRQVLTAMRQLNVPRERIEFLQVPVDTIWTRDYGPVSVRDAQGTHLLVDAEYEDVERAGDDRVPGTIAPLLGMKSVPAPLVFEGGNLLSNGEGILVTSTRVLENNLPRGYTNEQIDQLLKTSYGGRQVVYLEPLAGEGTGHVDMFTTFISADTVLVGFFPPHADPVNAEILDRNAEQLSRLKTTDGPLKVVRIPMPQSDVGIFRTYTNVLYANGVVLVPQYPGVSDRTDSQARAVFRTLLRDWTVIGIDCNELISLGGGIHCVTMNMCGLPPRTDNRLVRRAPRMRRIVPLEQWVPTRHIPEGPEFPWTPADSSVGWRTFGEGEAPAAPTIGSSSPTLTLEQFLQSRKLPARDLFNYRVPERFRNEPAAEPVRSQTKPDARRQK